MLNKTYLGLFLAFFVFQLASAQEKKLSMEQAVMGLYTDLRVENLKQLSWLPETDRYVHVSTNDADEAILESGLPGKTGEEILSIGSLSSALGLEGDEALKSFPSLSWIDSETFHFWRKDQLWSYNLKEKAATMIIKLPAEREHLDYHAESNRAVYAIGDNLFVNSKDGQKRITEDGGDGIVYGQAVHRFEFGISKGTFFSPEGKYVAFYRKDESMVTEYPLVDIEAGMPAALERIKYPMAGQKSHHVTLGVYNFRKNKVHYINTTGPEDQYLTNISWSPDEKYIIIALLNREQNHLQLNVYNASNGKLSHTLFEERDEQYVEPENPPIFILGEKEEFLWFSERDGWNHLYHYNMDGELLGQISSGDWVITKFLGFDKSAKNIFVQGVKDDHLSEQIFKIDLKKKRLTLLSSSPGLHSGNLSPSGKYLIDNFSSDDIPRKINIVDAKGRIKDNLLTAENTLKDYKLAEVRKVELQAEDGTILHGKLMLPPNMEKGKKYPVITYLYGGPHYQLVRNRFPASGNLWYDYMVNKGYIVFTMDNRGSSNRGLEFEQATFRNLGEKEIKDQLRGLEYLKGLDFVDAERIGVHGWSYGGYMTTSLMTKEAGAYKVGVAGGPVINWDMYEIMYTERYMDTPEENPEGFENTDLCNYAKDLEGRLLIIHGAQDDVVVWQHSLSFVRQCVVDDILLDYFVYPSHPHNVRGKDRVHLMKKISQYFDDFL